VTWDRQQTVKIRLPHVSVATQANLVLNVPNVPQANIEKAMTRYLVIVVSVKRDCTKANLVKVHAFRVYLASTPRPKERGNAKNVLPIPFLM